MPSLLNLNPSLHSQQSIEAERSVNEHDDRNQVGCDFPSWPTSNEPEADDQLDTR